MAEHYIRKENYLRALRGEMPIDDALVSRPPLPGEPATVEMLFPSIYGRVGTFEAGTDIWGATYISSDGSEMMVMPDPKTHLMELDDITHWQDFIKAPDLEGYDWEAAAKKDWENAGIDVENSVAMAYIDNSPFIHLTAFMGFENALIAMAEEPEETAALFEYLTDFYAEVTQKVCEYYHPELISTHDDLASKTYPMISLDCFREQLLPQYKRLFDIGHHYGIPCEHHICGKGEIYIDDLVKIGMNSWNSATPFNDLEAIQKKYGRSLLLNVAPEVITMNANEECIRQQVRDVIDKFAPNGGFSYYGYALSAGNDTSGILVDQ